MPRSNYKENPLENNAIRNVSYQKDCEMIEKAAIAASSEIYPYIIKSVTNDLSFQFIEYDEKLGRPPPPLICKLTFIQSLFTETIDNQ